MGVSSISQDSNSGTEVMTPNIEVSEDSESKLPQAVDAQGAKKRPTGPMLIPSPEMVASMPLSPGVQFSRRRPSLGKSPTGNGGAANNNSGSGGKGRNTLDP